VVKEKEKDNKEKRGTVPKAEKQLLKDNQEKELEMWKDNNTNEFNLQLKEKAHGENKKFSAVQLEELQAVQLRTFLEVIYFLFLFFFLFSFLSFLFLLFSLSADLPNLFLFIRCQQEFERRKLAKELMQHKKIKHLEALQMLELNQTTQVHNLEREHQDKTRAFEENQLLENHRQFEKDLKKYQTVSTIVLSLFAFVADPPFSSSPSPFLPPS